MTIECAVNLCSTALTHELFAGCENLMLNLIKCKVVCRNRQCAVSLSEFALGFIFSASDLLLKPQRGCVRISDTASLD